MDNFQGMTVSPQVVETDNGSEIVGFDVHSGAPGGQWTDAADMYETSEGELHHRFEDVELQSEGEPFDESEADQMIVEAVMDLYPHYDALSDYIAATRTFEEIQAYNQAVDTNDFESILPFLEQINDEYIANGGFFEETNIQDDQPLEDQQEAVEEWFASVDDEVIDDTLDELFATEYDELDLQLLNEAFENVEHGSPHAAILQAGIEIGNGMLTMEQAIDRVASQYGDAVAAAAYYELQDYFNAQ